MMLEVIFLWKSTSQKQIGKKLISSIDASPPNGSPLDIGWKLVDRNYQLLWFESDQSPISLNITYECEKHDGKILSITVAFFVAFLT